MFWHSCAFHQCERTNVKQISKPTQTQSVFEFASQGQHIRKFATEQMKILTLVRTPTQVLGISSADALPTKLRVPVGGTEFLSL